MNQVSSPIPDITFGVILPVGRRLELRNVGDSASKWATTVHFAQLVESLGYDSVWLYDHLHNIPRRADGSIGGDASVSPLPSSEAVFESWTALAALSQRTERVRLGHIVGNNLIRSPALVAKMAATVDVMSGGRLEWGIGAGHDPFELEAYGYRLPPPGERIDMLAEAVELVRELWTHNHVNHHGRFYQTVGAQCDPKPIQKPHPPILIGGGGEKRTLREVARLADRSNFGGSPDEWRHKNDVLTGHCKDVGRDPSEIFRTSMSDVFVTENDGELPSGWTGGPKGETDDCWRESSLVGTPKMVIEKMRQYVDHGCRGFIIWCADFPAQTTLELFAEKVMPEFR